MYSGPVVASAAVAAAADHADWRETVSGGYCSGMSSQQCGDSCYHPMSDGDAVVVVAAVAADDKRMTVDRRREEMTVVAVVGETGCNWVVTVRTPCDKKAGKVPIVVRG